MEGGGSNEKVLTVDVRTSNEKNLFETSVHRQGEHEREKSELKKINSHGVIVNACAWAVIPNNIIEGNTSDDSQGSEGDLVQCLCEVD